MRRSVQGLNRGAHNQPYLIRDKMLFAYNSGQNKQNLRRAGVEKDHRALLKTGKMESQSFDHAFPLLSHTDFGHQDHIANTHYVMMNKYMPKRTKGSAPWYRGNDTYSVLYSEQGRYEYQRHMLLARMPSMYRAHFMRFLASIRVQAKKPHDDHYLNLNTANSALHWIHKMIVENFNPQHIHYQAAMASVMSYGEFDMARDIWKIMERQQTWPDDKLIVQYLDILAAQKEKALAIECWNRYCTEKGFLKEGEADPKPISRIPFTLNRDETLYLPKWKKFFEHDPNLDVTDLNRFNTTRDIYRAMAGAMLSAGDVKMFNQFFDELEEKLLSTPTPVPEPPNPFLSPKPKWGPHLAQDTIQRSPWRLKDSVRANAQGPTTASIDEMHRRFHSNEQFILTASAHFVSLLIETRSVAEPLKLIESLTERAFKVLGKKITNLDTRRFFAQILVGHRVLSPNITGQQLHQLMRSLLERKAKAGGDDATETGHPAMYLEILKAFAQEAKRGGPSFDPKRIIREVNTVANEMNVPSFVWSADIHLAMMDILVHCGTMRANEYFVKNVLRQFQWSSEFCEVLYKEYRKHSDVEMWAELTKRMLVWTARYDVRLEEPAKRLIEEDYETIKVQVRTMRELVVFRARDIEEKRIARHPANQLPNPVADYVSHALPFPDRDTGAPNEYGDIGQWRDPDKPVYTPFAAMMKPKGYIHGAGEEYKMFGPQMFDQEQQRGYYGEWKQSKAPTGGPKMPSPWDRNYKQYARGTNPSYDQVYAGPHPEIFPNRFNFRRMTRWDFKSVERQSKFRMNGAY